MGMEETNSPHQDSIAEIRGYLRRAFPMARVVVDLDVPRAEPGGSVLFTVMLRDATHRLAVTDDFLDQKIEDVRAQLAKWDVKEYLRALEPETVLLSTHRLRTVTAKV